MTYLHCIYDQYKINLRDKIRRRLQNHRNLQLFPNYGDHENAESAAWETLMYPRLDVCCLLASEVFIKFFTLIVFPTVL